MGIIGSIGIFSDGMLLWLKQYSPFTGVTESGQM